MRAAGSAGLLSILVSLLLAAILVVLIYPQSAAEKATPRKQDSAAARAAADAKAILEKAPPPVPIAVLRLPPPPAAHPAPVAVKPPVRPAPKAAPVKVIPLRPSQPVRQAKPQPLKKFPVLTEAAKKPRSAPQTPSKAPPVRADAKSRKAGRTLLRLLEHGKGPSVEIAWPDSVAAREVLYRRLTRCYGMQGAVMDGADRLFAASGPKGAPWKMNLDRYSGFLRAPAGLPIEEESRKFTRIGARHRLSDWRPVRIFPRSVDAVLLGGLQQIVAGAYEGARTITAAYRVVGRRLMLDSVRVNGGALPGSVDLTAAAAAACRRGA